MELPIKIHFSTKNEELQRKVTAFIEDWYSEKSYIEAKTSGSTGTPKIIKLCKSTLIASAHLSNSYFNYSSGKKSILSLSIDTIGGKMIVIRALEFKMDLIVTDNVKNPIANLKIPAYIISLVPYQLLNILEETPQKLNLIENILLGGAPVSNSLNNQIQYLNSNYFESYGMTETMSHIAIKNLKSKNQHFEALGKTTFTLQNDTLVIHAPEIGIDNLLTNDIINLISPTTFSWLGRKDFVILSGGKKFHPEILEKKLENRISQRFFIFKEADDKLGEKIVLYIENIEDHNLRLKIEKILIDSMEKYEVPKKIYFISKFSETESGKINRIETSKKVTNEH